MHFLNPTVGLVVAAIGAGAVWLVTQIGTPRSELPPLGYQPPAPPPRMLAALTIIAPEQSTALAARPRADVENIPIALALYRSVGPVPLSVPKAFLSDRTSANVTFGFRMDDAISVRIGPIHASLTSPEVAPVTASWADLVGAAPAGPALDGWHRDLVINVPVLVTTDQRSEATGTLELKTDRAQRVLLTARGGGLRFAPDAPPRSPLTLAYISLNEVARSRVRGLAPAVRDVDLIAVDDSQSRDHGECPDKTAMRATDAHVTIYDRRSGAVRGEQTFTAPTPSCEPPANITKADPEVVDRWLDTFIQPPIPQVLAPPPELLAGEETKWVDALWKVFGISGRASAQAFVKKLGEPTRHEVLDEVTEYAWGGAAITLTLLNRGAFPEALSFDGAGRNLLTDLGLKDPSSDAIGMPLAELTKRYGKPTRYVDETLFYERAHGKDRVLVTFALIPGGQWQCKAVTVQWTLE